ncbi:MAG: dTDP-glucose 4,6-dehydratase [Elusimicrobia bacterium]|nr:dTDP-glucose 4,6-dehydratase [Elusimicrobiota bacterium]
MRVAVTGGLGFIGSNFVRHMLGKHPGCSIINIDKLTYAGNPANLRGLERSPRYKWARADVADTSAMRRLLKGADAVVHFAAETHVDRSILGAAEFVRTNVLGTQVLLDAARACGVSRFVHVGTDEVYGSVPRGKSRESDNLLPNSPYAASKAAADLVARSYFRTYGFPVIITRCSNNFGPCQYPEKALPLLVTNALEDRRFPLYGDGRQMRDWLYVQDHVLALDLVLRRGRPGEIYNIGAGAPITNLELVSKVLKLMGKPSSLITRVPDRPGHDRRYALDCSKIRRELGWKPVYEFERALRLSVEWYAHNREWWEPLKRHTAYKQYCARQYGAKKEN